MISNNDEAKLLMKNLKMLTTMHPKLDVLLVIKSGNETFIETNICLKCIIDSLEEFIDDEGIEHVCEYSQLDN